MSPRAIDCSSVRCEGRSATARAPSASLAGVLIALVALNAAAPASAHRGELELGPALAPVGVADDDPAALGSFGDPFAEPTVAGTATAARCVRNAQGRTVCKPAAGSLAVLGSGRVLYWDALEGTERVQGSILAEFGAVAMNDQARVLDLSGGTPAWSVPSPADGGANPGGYESDPLFGGGDSNRANDGALFCSDLAFLPGGAVLAAGGTAYYGDPELGGSGSGVFEVEGLRNARIYDPETNEWTQTGSMHRGRWYPSLVTLGDGDVFVASGVKRLVKPIYLDRPLDSGANVRETETYDPERGRWRDNGQAARRSLPLYPRLHLLPDGRVFYNAAGQAFNPFGQAYDEALWNVAAVYDPAGQRWQDLGIPGLDRGSLVDLRRLDLGNPVRDVAGLGLPGAGSSATLPGFRGSTFSIMLPLEPDAEGHYARASFLTAGGVFNPPSPGSYLATSDSRITTVDTRSEALWTRPTGDMSRPRWYSSAVLLPTGEVIALNGSDRDAVATPGLEFPVKQAELFDPATERWRPLGESHRPRTYHNSAALLPDGRVLLGGHAPPTTLYLRHMTLPGGFGPNEGRDPSFEIYNPPYLFRGRRPEIASISPAGYGGTMTVEVAGDAKEIASVVLVRTPSVTHLIDGDQRSVELPIERRSGSTLTVGAPPDGNVAPPGPYMLFVNREADEGLVPSVAREVELGG